jgi:allantoinase
MPVVQSLLAAYPKIAQCCPPIRPSSNRDLLWQALKDGDIESAISDHSPCVSELKQLSTGDFMRAWGGIGGLGLGLSLMHTESKRRDVDICQLVRWMAENPAKQIKVEDRKGSLRVGADADFVVFDPNARFLVRRFLCGSSSSNLHEGDEGPAQVQEQAVAV